MSRNAVSCEHFASLPYFILVSFRSKPSSKPLTTRRCRSFNGESPKVYQKCALESTVPSVACAPLTARPRHCKNQSIHGVMSIVAFCVRSRMS
jgi:hypothetical protein